MERKAEHDIARKLKGIKSRKRADSINSVTAREKPPIGCKQHFTSYENQRINQGFIFDLIPKSFL